VKIAILTKFNKPWRLDLASVENRTCLYSVRLKWKFDHEVLKGLRLTSTARGNIHNLLEESIGRLAQVVLNLTTGIGTLLVYLFSGVYTRRYIFSL